MPILPEVQLVHGWVLALAVLHCRQPLSYYMLYWDTQQVALDGRINEKPAAWIATIRV